MKLNSQNVGNSTEYDLLPSNMTGKNLTENQPYLYLEHHSVLMGFTALLLALSAAIGTFGNVLIIFAVSFVKSLRTTSNIFVLNLALADLVVTLLVDPFNAIGVTSGRNILLSNEVLCNWIASFCGPACVSSMWNMCAISVNRYVLICKPHIYSKIYSFKTTILLCVVIWILAHLFHSPNHLGWGHSRFNTEYYLCTFDISTYSYAIFYVMMGVVVPLVGVLFGYVNIFIHVHNVKVHLRENQRTTFFAANSNRMEQDRVSIAPSVQTVVTSMRIKRPHFTLEDVKLAKTLFTTFLVFLICWFPFTVFVLAHNPPEIPGWMYTVAIILAHGNSAVNPILYGLMNEKFRDGYRKVLGWTGPNRVHHATIHHLQTQQLEKKESDIHELAVNHVFVSKSVVVNLM